jgi:hypothetical protein
MQENVKEKKERLGIHLSICDNLTVFISVFLFQSLFLTETRLHGSLEVEDSVSYLSLSTSDTETKQE